VAEVPEESADGVSGQWVLARRDPEQDHFQACFAVDGDDAMDFVHHLHCAFDVLLEKWCGLFGVCQPQDCLAFGDAWNTRRSRLSTCRRRSRWYTPSLQPTSIFFALAVVVRPFQILCPLLLRATWSCADQVEREEPRWVGSSERVPGSQDGLYRIF